MNFFDADMPADAYHAHEAMSNSKLTLFARDPNLLEWSEHCPVDDEKMRTLDFGTAVHMLCLEPHRMDDEFVVMPKFDGRTKQGKADKAAFLAEHAGRKFLAADEHRKMSLMFESIMAHPAARMLIEAEGIAEGSFFWTDRETGVDCRCRPDKLIGPVAVDIKTTADLAKFKYSVEDYRYYVQDPYYRAGLAACGMPADEMRFLVVQTTVDAGRYPCMVVRLPDEVVQHGRETYQRNLRDYAEWRERRALVEYRELEMHHWFLAAADNATVEGIR